MSGRFGPIRTDVSFVFCLGKGREFVFCEGRGGRRLLFGGGVGAARAQRWQRVAGAAAPATGPALTNRAVAPPR